MEDIDYWRLAVELTIVQAALLVAGEDPATLANDVERLDLDARPKKYEAAKYAIKQALFKGRISGEMYPELDYDQNGNPEGPIPGTVDVQRSFVEVESLRHWLEGRGIHNGFFFPEIGDKPDYLDPEHPRFAPKLDAAVRAWNATSDLSALKGRTPKQALMKWLRENAAAYGWTNDDGTPSDNTLDEIAKIANWRPTGGAPKTPGQDED